MKIFIAFLASFILFCVAVYITIKDTPKKNTPQLHEYQIDVDNDSIYLFDGNKYIGAAPWSDGKLDSLILNDNR